MHEMALLLAAARVELEMVRKQLAVAEAVNAELRERVAVANDCRRLEAELNEGQQRDAALALLREACIAWENAHDYSGDGRLRLIPIFETWFKRAKAAGGGDG